jgi:Fe-S-cluster-containing dehydrogenase component
MLNESDDVSRRSFLKLLGASLALAGLDGCTRIPAEKILPYVTQPPELTPGVPVHYATSMVLDGFATGLVVEAHEGRPTKIEGNPDHPASLGASGVLEQASLLQLYDPHRATFVRSARERSTWEAFAAAFAPDRLRGRVGPHGERLALLLEPTSSPLTAELLSRLQALYPRMSVYYYAPFARTGALLPQYDLQQADVILSVDADFLGSGPFSLRYARQFADRRRDPRRGMNRLYAAESSFSITGAAADHRLRRRPSALDGFLASLQRAAQSPDEHATSENTDDAWIRAAAADLRAHPGRSLVIAGDRLAPGARGLVDAINTALGNAGVTAWYTPSPLLGAGDDRATLPALVDAMRGGAVDTLVCIGGNPGYASPASLGFAEEWRRVPNSAYVGLYEDETAAGARWFVPAAHYLESWGDARAYDGTLSVVQPLVQPLHGGKAMAEVLAALAGTPNANALDLLRARWRVLGAAPDDEAWSAALRRGFVAATSTARAPAPYQIGTPPGVEAVPAAGLPPGVVDVVFVPDARVHDGAFANNPWLQELPDPITKLTWDNAALVSPATAKSLDAENGDALVVQIGNASVQIPVLVVPGHADETVTLPLGYGRTGAEEIARDVGVDAYRVWPRVDGFTARAIIRRADLPRHAFAITQAHWTMEGRDQARSETLSEYRVHATQPPRKPRRELTIYDPVQRLGAPQQWAMTIDLGTCIGCSACVVACQAENNIPVVGKDEVMNSREMHWIRIDRYVEGARENPNVVTQPMLCQQCENAPCEYVCPVGATTHSDDGLNEMIYNRCVGTRFCSNNCPYKVRRFNWFDYNAHLTEIERMVKNPDVTVRERGVMEKCTFCVQRIREAEIAAATAGRPLRGDEVKTACQQACPTNAIVFGSLTEPEADVVRRREDARAYGVLEDLGTEPRVRYLARIRNPNPALESR